MDLSAPLPPCVADIVAVRINTMLDDFIDLEEWFFAFDKAPTHEKDAILEGFVNGTYHDTIKKRRKDCLPSKAHMNLVSEAENTPPYWALRPRS